MIVGSGHQSYIPIDPEKEKDLHYTNAGDNMRICGGSAALPLSQEKIIPGYHRPARLWRDDVIIEDGNGNRMFGN